ncbi:MAG TPA: DUF1902 domain-containing protein [Rhodanobacteraceae bacterium]|nr:DUF1902 domain-containing protein [Rhodanobacteraceae bacterium]
MSNLSPPLYVRAEWDPEASVWVASSDEVPGLITEADTIEALVTKLESLIPELLELNTGSRHEQVPFELLARRFDVARTSA